MKPVTSSTTSAIMPWRPLDPDFDGIVIEMAKRVLPDGFNADPNAPQTYDELIALMSTGSTMTVWDGASSTTIYGSPDVNYAFRAWHDAVHWQLKLPFTFEGEAAVAIHQINQLRHRYHNHPRLTQLCAILFAEITGQAIYAELHNDFPKNQRRFTKRFLEAVLDEQPDLPK